MKSVAQLVIGTAGHIDHGKSRLVWSLTGSDPDRLPEEKARGMTIDLGFAHLREDGCDLWFVDVPGHERFLRNMVAGASGIDLALFVVAADDAIMPQTREHAEVLSLLGVSRCVVALTKMDLVDSEWADAVEQEVRQLLGEHNVQPIAVVRTSAEDGRGLAELRGVLRRCALETPRGATPYTWFRLPVDRSFNVAGRGTVVTGTVMHGGVQREHELELWPAGTRVRVRDLQLHNEQCAGADGRMRLALNLAGVSLEDVYRGCELATPGYLAPTRRLDTQLAALRMPGKQVRQRIRVRLHIATRELLAEVRLAALPASVPLCGVFAQIVTAEPVVAAWGQRFILRDESGARTLGGGTVLQTAADLWTARRSAVVQGLRRLHTGTAAERLEEAIRGHAWDEFTDAQLAARSGLPDESAIAAALGKLRSSGRVQLLEEGSQRLLLHSDAAEDVSRALNEKLSAFLHANPRAAGLPRGQWPGWMPRICPARFRTALADWLIQRKRVEERDGFILPRNHAAALPPADETLLAQILGEFRAAGFQPPVPQSLRCLTPRNQTRVLQLIDLAAARKQLVRIAEDIWLHGESWQDLLDRVSAALRAAPQGLTVAELRSLLGSSRKYMVPICEHLDAIGVTRRIGDRRVLRNSSKGPDSA